MSFALLIIPVTDQKIAVIKRVREITGWGLYEAKEGVENGFIFDNTDAAARFMRNIETAVGLGVVSWRVQPYRTDGGPRDARNLVPHQL